ncbi:Ag1 [Aphelenchoides avenae]|nr:Ag1 [Aphelenchus avenae]
MAGTLRVVALVALAACAFAQQGLPPFLQGAPQSTVQEFQQLLATGNAKTDTQIDAEVDAWVQKQSAGIKTKYAQFKADLKKQQEQAEAAHRQSVARFSPQAKEADAKLTAIANNPSLSATQKAEQIQSVVKTLAPAVRQEIESAMQG